MDELSRYIKEHPDETLLVGPTNLGQWYVRPMTWCGGWKDNKFVMSHYLAYFPTKADAERALVELNYENG
ncbi:MAG TPA: hypothetical protein VFD33_02435 [Bacillota bacterium]|nr:hypothetical protein [Bacillota bacterium]